EIRDDSPDAFFWLFPTTTSAWSALATLYQARTMISTMIRRMTRAATATPIRTNKPPAARYSTPNSLSLRWDSFDRIGSASSVLRQIPSGRVAHALRTLEGRPSDRDAQRADLPK